MAGFVNNCVTDAGTAAIAKALKGGTLTFTRIVMGDSALPQGQDVRKLEGVISPKATLDISKCEFRDPDTAIIGGVYLNNEEGTGFWWRELGLYATDPDEGVGEILYAYGNTGEFAEWIPPSGGQTVIEKVVDVITTVDSRASVDVRIAADAYATVEQYEQYRQVAQEASSQVQSLATQVASALVYARGAYGLAQGMKTTVDEVVGKVETIWTALFTEVTKNPWMLTFANLDQVSLTSGSWNEAAARLEC